MENTRTYYGEVIGNVDIDIAKDIIERYKLPYVLIEDSGEVVVVDLWRPVKEGGYTID